MRDWWLRALLVLQRPRPVFVALRDDSKEAASDRAEPVLAIVLLAGIATVLSTRTAGTLMDDGSYDGLLVAIWAFLAGSIYGAFGYFAFGALLHGGVKALGSQGSYRRARHVLRLRRRARSRCRSFSGRSSWRSTARRSSAAAAATTGPARASSTCWSSAFCSGRPRCSCSACAPCTAGPGPARVPPARLAIVVPVLIGLLV